MKKLSHVVFFDDACPLCNSEIKHYKAIKSLHHIEWLGIYQNWDQISPYGLSRETLLRRIHAVHSDGTVLTGAAVFVLIWRSLQYYHLLGRFVSTFHLVPVLDFFYKYFADWRYKKTSTAGLTGIRRDECPAWAGRQSSALFVLFNFNEPVFC